MDSWQKLSQLRAEVEAANARADEAEAKVKKLEEEHIQKEHETSSLESRVKLLQEQLDKAESDFKEASEKYVFGEDGVVMELLYWHTILWFSFREADLRAEQFEKKANNLQQELDNMESKHEEMCGKYQAAKAEMDELERQLEGV